MNPPANWYPDPTGRHGQRYWDGEQWTEHVFTEGVQGVDPLDAADADEQQDGTSGERGPGAGQEAGAHDARDDAAPGASGLFADAGEAPTGAGADEEATWAPEDQARNADHEDQAVAPEVEPGDVVGNLDEVSETDDAGAAAAAVAQEPQDASTDVTDQEAVADEDPAADAPGTPAEDFSDAFMVTPETVSRLVSRQAAAEPQAPQEAPETPDDDGQARTQEEPPAAAAVADRDGPRPEPQGDATPTGTTGAIDAPPPSVPQQQPEPGDGPAATTVDGALGITGDLVGGAFAEREDAGPVALQNARLLRCSLGDGAGVIARQGTMVAYQGEVSFERQGAGGVTRALKRAATGEGLAMMRAEGSGEVFLADAGQHVFLLHLEGGPGLSVNGRNVLAFSADLQWDIERVKGATLLAGGLFNTSLTGTGWVALVSDGEPVVLRTDEAPTHVDVNALVAWSGGLTTRITNTVSAKSLVGLGSGEAFQMAFDGVGIVVVQPSEGLAAGAAAT